MITETNIAVNTVLHFEVAMSFKKNDYWNTTW